MLFVSLVIMGGCSFSENNPISSPQPTPPEEDGGIQFVLFDITGNEVSFQNFRGKPAVLIFFKTYCPHCQDEAPFLETVYQKYRDQVEFLGIAVNEQGTSGALIAERSMYAIQVRNQFVERYGWTFPVLIDDYGRVQRELAGTGVPSLVFVDARGFVKKVIKEVISQSALEQAIVVYLL